MGAAVSAAGLNDLLHEPAGADQHENEVSGRGVDDPVALELELGCQDAIA